MDPSNIGTLDFSTFCSNVPKALHASIRSTRQGIRESLMLKSLATFVAIINLCYVLVSSLARRSNQWEDIVVPAGAIVVFLCVFEVALRLCLSYMRSMPISTTHRCLDGLAVLAGAISLYGEFFKLMVVAALY